MHRDLTEVDGAGRPGFPSALNPVTRTRAAPPVAVRRVGSVRSTAVSTASMSARVRRGQPPAVPNFEITPIGTVLNNRTDVQHTDNGGAVRSTTTTDERFGETCLQGLEGYSHVEVLFIFDQFPKDDDYRGPRPYRSRSGLPPGGVFAGRGPRRPNHIGVTSCAVRSVHGRELTVMGLDAASGPRSST